MKIFKINDVLIFGKYKGKSIKYILNSDLDYIKWSLINLHHFYMRQETLKDISELYPEFELAQNIIEALEIKDRLYEDLNRHIIKHEDETGDEQESYTWEDFVADALGGEPEAYWNID